MNNLESSDLVISSDLPADSSKMDDLINSLSFTHVVPIPVTVPYFQEYITLSDADRHLDHNLPVVDGIRIEINDSYLDELTFSIKRDDKSVVIYPLFTSIAYNEPGFYTYFRGQCDTTCIVERLYKYPTFAWTSSGKTAQILYHVGYDFLTDAEVDQNPKLLENYDTVILLHNEYVTKEAFNAISNHPNLIFLFPNALYAEVEANHESETITLIRGHQYPPPDFPANGFDYEIEEKFHHYEYDSECLDWEFIKIPNGYHLNCYPDDIIDTNLDILKKMKEL